jgi:hypothetical protein
MLKNADIDGNEKNVHTVNARFVRPELPGLTGVAQLQSWAGES